MVICSQPAPQDVSSTLTFEQVWSIVEPLLCGIIIPAFVSWLVSYITTNTRIRKEKQAYAKLKLYLVLNMLLKELQTINGSLETCENPYGLLYSTTVIRSNSFRLKLPGGDYNSCIKRYEPLMTEIMKLIDSTDSIYPQKIEKEKWEKNLNIIRSFGRMIIDAEGLKEQKQYDENYKDKYEKLKMAIETIINATELV